MDPNDSPGEAQFRSRVRDWLAATLPTLSWPEPAPLEEKRAFWSGWQRKLFDGGFAGLSWPTEYGGAGADAKIKAVFNEELDRAGAPERLNIIGEDFAGPTIVALRQRRAEAALPRADPAGHRDLVPTVLRAGVGLRPRLAAHQGDEGGRRVADPGPEDLDLPRTDRRQRHPARPDRRRRSAQGHHLLPAPDGLRGHHGPSARAHARRGRVQRGLPRRRVRSRLRRLSARSTAAGGSRWARSRSSGSASPPGGSTPPAPCAIWSSRSPARRTTTAPPWRPNPKSGNASRTSTAAR